MCCSVVPGESGTCAGLCLPSVNGKRQTEEFKLGVKTELQRLGIVVLIQRYWF